MTGKLSEAGTPFWKMDIPVRKFWYSAGSKSAALDGSGNAIFAGWSATLVPPGLEETTSRDLCLRMAHLALIDRTASDGGVVSLHDVV